MKNNTAEIALIINSLEYKDKRDIFEKCFSIGNFGTQNVNDILILLSLVSLTFLKLKEKDPNVTPLSILTKITNQRQDNSEYYKLLESLSILVEDLTYNCTKADNCGLNNSQEIITKIKEILNTWLPF